MIPIGIILDLRSETSDPPPAGSAALAHLKDVMDKCFRLVGAPAQSGEVVHISGIRSHAPALGGSVTPPWPRQDGWQRRLHAAAHIEKEGKP